MKDTTLLGVTENDANPAWLLQVELKTRITTQPLHYRSGDEESALESVHQLFDSTRKLLEENPKAKAFEKSALFLLNSILRSNTARWHRWLVDEKFRDEQKRRQFRYELKQVQPLLLRFANFLGLLAQGAGKSGEAAQMFKEIVEATPDPKGAYLGATVLARIGNEIEFKDGVMGSKFGNFVTAEQINAAEREFIHRRRKALGEEEADVGNDEPVKDATGLCLSGGGIRSATFCLGIVQVLEREGMLTKLDYLSTVSGGGYLGTFLSAFLGTPAPQGNGTQSQAEAKSAAAVRVTIQDAPFNGASIRAAIDTAFDPKNGSESGAIRHLRNNSRYLATGGTWTLIKIIGLLISGILTTILLVLPVPLVGVLFIFLARARGLWGDNGSNSNWLRVSVQLSGMPAFIIFGAVTALLGVLWFMLPVVRNVAHGAPPDSWRKKLRTFWETLSLLVAVAVVATGTFVLLPKVFYFLGFLRDRIATVGPLWKGLLNAETLGAIGAIAPVLLGVIAARLNAGLGKKLATILFLLSGPALYPSHVFLCR